MDDESLFFHLRVGEKEPYITIDDSVLLLQMANRIQRNNSRIKEQLLQDLNNGIKVAIHGATNGLNCILFLNQLQNHPNLEIFDGDSSKADKFLPAFEKPIIDAKSPKYKSFILGSSVPFTQLVNASLISLILYFFAKSILFFISGIGFFPTSAILPANIDIITFDFLFILFKIINQVLITIILLN